MNIKACLFDLDGVLVDTARYHYLAWRQLANELGFEFSERQNEALKGVSRMRSLEIMLAYGGRQNDFSESEKLEMATRKNDRYVEMISAMTPEEILPEVERFLGEVRAAGIKVALGSASRNAPLILERTGLTRYFDAIVDGSMIAEAKPDPAVFLLGARLTGTDPRECVVFEDARAGIEAAARGGMRSVGVGGSETLEGATIRIDGFEGFTVKKMRELL